MFLGNKLCLPSLGEQNSIKSGNKVIFIRKELGR
jgi:hypothetical protein